VLKDDQRDAVLQSNTYGDGGIVHCYLHAASDLAGIDEDFAWATVHKARDLHPALNVAVFEGK
jgi:hypothetical protein